MHRNRGVLEVAVGQVSINQPLEVARKSRRRTKPNSVRQVTWKMSRLRKPRHIFSSSAMPASVGLPA
jgi:hypothetical protein